MTAETISVPLGDAQLVVPKGALVRAYLEQFPNGSAPTLPVRTTPVLGEFWEDQGGIYAGTFCDVYGKPTHHLVLAEAKPERMTWQQAKDWAAKLQLDGHRDFRLPRRQEGLSLFLHLKDRFDKEWHWLEEPYEPYAVCAWGQLFNDGGQYGLIKDSGCRARAVRMISVIHDLSGNGTRRPAVRRREGQEGEQIMNQQTLMQHDPATGESRPYPSHADQWRRYHGQAAWLFNPWTGKRRLAEDVGSDTFGHLIVPPTEPVFAAPAPKDEAREAK